MLAISGKHFGFMPFERRFIQLESTDGTCKKSF